MIDVRQWRALPWLGRIARLQEGGIVMLAALVHTADTMQRLLHALVRTAGVVIESFREAQDFRRQMPRIHMDD
jgi:hypothetical protein